MKNVLLVLLAVVGFQASAGSTDMHLQLDGIESYDEKAIRGPFEILAWSWGTSAPSGSPEKGESASGVQDLSLTKYIGSESPHIMKLISMRKTIKRVTLTITNSNKMIIILKDARFTHQSMGGSGGEDRLTENVTLSFSEIEFQTSFKVEGKDQLSSAVIQGQ